MVGSNSSGQSYGILHFGDDHEEVVGAADHVTSELARQKHVGFGEILLSCRAKYFPARACHQPINNED